MSFTRFTRQESYPLEDDWDRFASLLEVHLTNAAVRRDLVRRLIPFMDASTRAGVECALAEIADHDNFHYQRFHRSLNTISNFQNGLWRLMAGTSGFSAALFDIGRELPYGELADVLVDLSPFELGALSRDSGKEFLLRPGLGDRAVSMMLLLEEVKAVRPVTERFLSYLREAPLNPNDHFRSVSALAMDLPEEVADIFYRLLVDGAPLHLALGAAKDLARA